MTTPQYTPVDPDKTAGVGDPPQDMNNTSLELAAMGGNLNVLDADYAGGADPTGMNDSTAAIAATLAAVPANGGTVLFPPGTYKVSSSLTVPWNAIVRGSGWGTQLVFSGTGACLAMSNPTQASGNYATQLAQSGGLHDLMIDGTSAGNDSYGIHFGNGLGFTIDNVFVRNFTGTGSAGIWEDDSIWWTEKTYFRATVANCTTCFYLTSTGTGSGSFEYSYSDLVAYWTNGQNGFWLNNLNGASSLFMGGRHNYWRGNCNGSSPGPFLTLQGGVNFKRCWVAFCPESNATAGTAQTIYDAGGGTNHFQNCQGWMDFGANAWAASNMAAGNLSFAGPIQGDVTLAALRTFVTKPTVTSPAVPAASTNVTNDFGVDCFVYVTGGTGVAIEINGGSIGQAAGMVYVPMGATINLGAYTVAPTWNWHAGPYP